MNKYFLLLIIFILFLFNVLLAQENLILDNEDITLSGEHTYNNITLTNNSTIWVGSDGELTIYADSIYIDETSQINTDGTSSGGPGNGGNGESSESHGSPYQNYYYGGGGGGAGYGNFGDDGDDSTHSGNPAGGIGGIQYGNNFSIQKGSKGGNSGTSWAVQGGNGGGCIQIFCFDLNIIGSISSNGVNGATGIIYNNHHDLVYVTGGGGGGSGGGIFLYANIIDGNGLISCEGGMGGDAGVGQGSAYGGNGSGGRITILICNTDNLQINVGNGELLNTIMPPKIFSTTHSNSNLFYNNNFVIISWNQLTVTFIQGYLYLFNNEASTIPDEETGSAISDTTVTLNDIEGIHFFHIVSVNNTGEIGQFANHFQININQTPPDIISSFTHPDSTIWYSINQNFEFSWDTSSVPNDDESFDGYWYKIDQNPNTIPTTNDNFVSDNELELNTELEDGIWYFHVLSEDTMGNLTETAGHFKFRVDAQSPYLNWSAPADSSSNVSADMQIIICLKDDGIGIDTTYVIFPKLNIEINGIYTEPDSIIGNPNEYLVYLTPEQPFNIPEIVTVCIEFQDLMTPVPHTVSDTFTFTTEFDNETPIIDEIYPIEETITCNILQNISVKLLDQGPWGIVNNYIDVSNISMIVNGIDYSLNNNELSWNQPYLEFQPANNFPEGEIIVTISGISDIFGNMMVEHEFSFLIDITGPIASNPVPINGESISTTQPIISVEINDAIGYVDPETIEFSVQGTIYTIPNNALEWNPPTLTFNSSTAGISFVHNEVVNVSLVSFDHIDYGESNSLQNSPFEWSFTATQEGLLTYSLVSYNGSALDSVLVQVTKTDTLIDSNYTNSNGAVEFTLPIGTYTVSATKVGYFYKKDNVEIILNQTSNLETNLSFPGDYNVDNDIDFYDLDAFATAWVEENSSIEFGPVIGTIPDFLVQADNILDFEDLMIFTLMWNYWNFQNPTYLAPIPLLNGNSGSAIVSLIPGNNSDNIITYKLNVSDINNYRSSRFILDYKPDELEFVKVEKGEYFTSGNEQSILLKVLDVEKGLIEIDQASFGNANKLNESILAQVKFKQLVSEMKNIIFFYEIRENDGEISQGKGESEIPEIQLKFALYQNYPNPFNPETQITFSLPETEHINLSVYNLKGQLVKILADEILPAGNNSLIWNGRNENDRKVSSGIYLLRLKSGNEITTKKIMMIK